MSVMRESWSLLNAPVAVVGWHAELVRDRWHQANRTLRCLTAHSGPAAFSTSMPDYAWDQGDLNSQASWTLDDLGTAHEDSIAGASQSVMRIRSERNRSTRVASLAEVSGYERTQSWCGYLEEGARRVFVQFGKGEASLMRWAKRRDLSPSLTLAAAMRACGTIAGRLNREGVATW